MAETHLIDVTGRTVFRGTQKPPGGGSVPVQSGNGPPGPSDENVTPTGIGYLYLDLANGGAWIAQGATSADWVAVGGWTLGASTDPASGVETLQNAGISGVVLRAITSVGISDTHQPSGFGNRLEWNSPGADGAQYLIMQLGSAGQFNHFWGSDGTYTAPNGIIFPTADPLVAGAWWDNAGVLTKSAGPPP